MNKKWIDFIWIAFLIIIGMAAGWYIISKIHNKGDKITMAGSVAMETFAEGITEVMEQYGIQTEPQFIGSSAGVESLLKGKAQIAMVSRYLTEEEKKQGIVENIIAYDGIVMVVNRENPIENLSREQLAKIFTGKIHNWKELGGHDELIVPIGRELGSGTRDSFEELLGITGRSQYSNECDSIGVVKAKVELISGAIGYVSMESVGENLRSKRGTVKIIGVEHIKPDITAIKSGEYFLVRPFIMATLGKIEYQDGRIQRIFDVLQKEQGVVVFEKAQVAPAKTRRIS